MNSIEKYLEEIGKYFENEIEVKKEKRLTEKIDDIGKNIDRIGLDLKKIENNGEDFRKSLINEYKLKNRITKEREKGVVASFINIIDTIENFLEEDNINEKKALLVKKIIKREVENINLRKTSKVGELYNEEYHTCIGYKRRLDKEDGQILEVVREGYVYRNHIIRQAEVIINNKKGGEIR